MPSTEISLIVVIPTEVDSFQREQIKQRLFDLRNEIRSTHPSVRTKIREVY